MGETITLRKAGRFQRFTLVGTVVTRSKGRGKTKGSVVRRSSWLNGVMARANRDRAVEELLARGWTVDRARAVRGPDVCKLLAKDMVVVGKGQSIALTRLSALAHSLDVSLPTGYAAFLRRLGPGELVGLQIFAPEDVARVTASWRKDIAPVAANLWSNLREVFGKEEELTLAVLARSFGGDVLLIGKGERTLWLAPRGSTRIHRVGTSFTEALGWWCFSDELHECEKDEFTAFPPKLPAMSRKKPVSR
jgi:hypothetical protein